MSQLDNKVMGCFFPIWAISTIVASAVLIVVIIVVLNRKWEAIKFFMFMHFDILPKDDVQENLDEMEFDAFITYRLDIIPLLFPLMNKIDMIKYQSQFTEINLN